MPWILFTFFEIFFFFKPCPSATLLGLSSHLLLPHGICLLYPFLMLAPFALFPLFSSVVLIYFWFPSATSDHLCFLILSPFHPHSNTRTPHPTTQSDSILLSSNLPSMSTFYITPQFNTTSRSWVPPLLSTHLIYQPLSFPLSPLSFSLECFIQLTIASNSFLITSADDFPCSHYSCMLLLSLPLHT